MFASQKKFLTSLRSSRAVNNERNGRLSDADGKASGQTGTAAVERVRMAMSGAMQACMAPAGSGNVGAGELVGEGSVPATRMPSVDEWLDDHINAQVGALQRQLQSARDLDTLWYLRPGLMNVIAVRQGEVAARDCLVALTALFKHAPPQARAPRS